jgi:hypothetical protein
MLRAVKAHVDIFIFDFDYFRVLRGMGSEGSASALGSLRNPEVNHVTSSALLHANLQFVFIYPALRPTLSPHGLITPLVVPQFLWLKTRKPGQSIPQVHTAY